jgi:hypothetical protein
VLGAAWLPFLPIWAWAAGTRISSVAAAVSVIPAVFSLPAMRRLLPCTNSIELQIYQRRHFNLACLKTTGRLEALERASTRCTKKASVLLSFVAVYI